jgi:hypothetical protein
MSRVIREPNENCDLHQALINTGYKIRREHYSHNGMHTGKVIDYYAPAIDYTTYKSESHSATCWRLQELDRRLGTDFYGDYRRDCRGFSTDY